MDTRGADAGYSHAERQLLLSIARRCLAERASGREPVCDDTELPQALLEKRGCFVTLFKYGELRGCIGHVLPQMPLHKAVCNNACSAGFHDPRFEPVSPAEVLDLEIEISLLSELCLLAGPLGQILEALRPGVDGVLLRRGSELSTFLPQVWNSIPGKEEFLSRLCLKADWPPDAWKGKDVSISTYQVVSFSDASPASY